MFENIFGLACEGWMWIRSNPATLAAILSALAAIASAIAAMQSRKISKQQANQSLFDQRFAVFMIVRRSLSEFRNQKLLIDDDWFGALDKQMFEAQNMARFLFDRKTQDEIKEIREKLQTLSCTGKSLRGELNDEERQQLREKEREVEAWCKEKNDSLHTMFEWHLDFTRPL
jgi:hypothetical protein